MTEQLNNRGGTITCVNRWNGSPDHQGIAMTTAAMTIVALSVLALVVAVVWARDMERFPDGPWDLEDDE